MAKVLGADTEEAITAMRTVEPLRQFQPARLFDLMVKIGKSQRYIEVKTGKQGMRTRIAAQLDRDQQLLANDVDVRWVFVASGRTGAIGPTPSLLTALESRGIPFEILWPE